MSLSRGQDIRNIEKLAVNIYRWHINRIFDEGESARGERREVHVTITPGSEQLLAYITTGGMQRVAGVQRDRLSWWQREEAEVEGFTKEDRLIRAVLFQNVVDADQGTSMPVEERGLEEDMVLLQFLGADHQDTVDSIFYQIRDEWHRGAIPDVSELVGFQRAQWIDFTQAARNMASRLYQAVSGLSGAQTEKGESG